MQSRRASLIEATANVLIGFWVPALAQAVIFPLFELHVTHGQHIQIAALFTLVSLARSYLLRRLFNYFNQK